MVDSDVPGTLIAAARRYPRREAAVFGRERVTYEQLLQRVSRLAHGLREAGLPRARPVAVLADNCLAYLELYYAVTAAGAILLPLNTRLAPPEIVAILRDADVYLILVGPGFEEKARDISTMHPVPLVPMPGASCEPALASYADLLWPSAHEYRRASPDDAAYIYYTSGSSGRPKGVVLTHRNVLTNALSTALALGLTERDVWLHAGPMFHLADAWAVWAITWLGGRHVLQRFDAERTVETITSENVTLTLLVPTAMRLLADAAAEAGTRLPGLRGLLYGGAPTPRRVLDEVRTRIDAPLVHTYGSTETAGTLCVLPATEQVENPGSLQASPVGRETPLVELRIADDKKGALGPGEVGEILVRGPVVTVGFLGQHQPNDSAFADGYYHTGDMGYRDKSGIVWLVGRGSDMIITGGENVYAGEVERVLLGMDQIADTAVVGLPHPKWTEEVTAFVVLTPGSLLTMSEVRVFASKHLGRYKVPRALRIVDDLPRNAAGKIDRTELRRRATPFTEEALADEHPST